MLAEFVLVGCALFLLFLGSEGLVRGSASLAAHCGLSPLVIGLTVVAFGTSSPELVVSTGAALEGKGDISVGNAVGSNIFNIGITLGLTALICPVPVQTQIVKIDAPAMIVTALLPPLLLLDHVMARWEGALLLLGLLGYITANFVIARKNAVREESEVFEHAAPKPLRYLAYDLFSLLVGLTVLIFGAQLLISSSVEIARHLGMSEAVIGLTIVAAGTSLPELATSVVAALRKEPDIAIGNVIGSNIFNVLAILGVTSLITPLSAQGVNALDYTVMIFISCLLLPLLWSDYRLRRLEGVLLLAIYGGYMLILWTF